ncbi:hypothetical protein AK830_g8540 [Neonectria ditissima]|uniref:DUF6546 domain-containing protein n=1 Tax=Neonectria ditissima TaxID=78410 RepID=A0A0P7BE31_9HYPO|nr:hypothetical protein AK830_g8540 [Neonectria ditissima]
MTGWPQLPIELRWMIINRVKQDYSWEWAIYARAAYASVCKEWQIHFERENFELLVLDQHRLQNFRTFVGLSERRRNSVRSIYLRVKLAKYDCTSCESFEDEATTKGNDELFVNTLKEFLGIVSAWERPNGPGILLDLGASSPSDSKHTFRDFRLTENYEHLAGYTTEGTSGAYEHHVSIPHGLNNTCPGWAHACGGVPRTEAAERITTTLGFAEFLSGYLPRTLREFHLFEDSNQILHPNRFVDTYRFLHPNRISDSYIGIPREFPRPFTSSPFSEPPPETALANCSRNLKTLSASFAVFAEHFFLGNLNIVQERGRYTQYYPNLETLVLTSGHLRPRSQSQASTLLLAGKVALCLMPRLQTMEIWNAGRGGGSLFQYKKVDGKMAIKWLSTEITDMSETFDAWQRIAEEEQPGCPISFKTELISGEGIGSYSDFLCHLSLGHTVLDPISRIQVHWENK